MCLIAEGVDLDGVPHGRGISSRRKGKYIEKSIINRVRELITFVEEYVSDQAERSFVICFVTARLGLADETLFVSCITIEHLSGDVAQLGPSPGRKRKRHIPNGEVITASQLSNIFDIPVP
jgi:hypothetical protein